MKNKYFKLPLFLVIAWIFAFIFEEGPRFILRNTPGIKPLWEIGNGWLTFFLVWYGALFLIAYFLFINKDIKYSVIFGILYGIIFETFYFHKLTNIYTFIIFVLLYFGMFYFPFKIIKFIYAKEKIKIKKSEWIIVIIAQLLLLALLFLPSWIS